MRKTKKTIAILAIVAMMLTMIPMQVFAAGTDTTRIAGTSRVQTAIVAADAGWTSATTAILAPSADANLVDALAAAPLAGQENAPILLTEGNKLNADTKAELVKLGVSKVYVIGAIDAAVTAEVEAMDGVTATALKGASRYETAAAIAAKLTAPAGTFIVGANATADALSVASYAAANKYAILLADASGKLPASETAVGTKTYVVGGSTLVADVTGATRLSGENRYDTNKAVINGLSYEYSKVYVANGENGHLVDSLIASSLAAKTKSPILLTDNKTVAVAADINTKLTAASKVISLGGTSVVSDAVAGTVKSTALGVVSVTATSATQLLVKFNKEVDKTDAQTTGRYKIGTGGPASAVLQADNKSVVLTMAAPITGTNLYVVDPVQSAALATEKSAIFTYVETYSDTVAPVVSKVEYPTYDTVKITFSEPMSSLGTTTFTQAGAAVTVTPTVAFVAGDSSITYSLANASVAVDKPVTITYVGALDQNNNLISPNPAVLSVTKTKSDVTAPTVVDAKALADNKVEITFSEKLSGNPTVTVGAKLVTFPAYDATKENKVFAGTFAPASSGIDTISVAAGYSDMSGNLGLVYSKLAQFSPDTTKPTVVSTEIKTFTVAGVPKQFAVVHYSEDVTPTAGLVTLTGTRVKDYITYSFTAAAAAPKAYTKLNNADVDDTKAIMIDITTDAAYLNGVYTLTLPAAYVADTASTPLASDATSISFTKGDISVSDTNAPVVTALPTFSADNSSMTVVFSEDMDPSTALNVANYKVGSSSIFTGATFIGDAKTVKLTVNPGTISIGGLYNVSISGAKDKAGNAVTAYSANITLKENVKPYVSSAKLVNSTTLEVSFSEALGAAPAVVNGDIEVYVNGTKVTLTSTTMNAGLDKATIVLSSAVTNLSDTIQVKLIATALPLVDVNGNTATTGVMVTATH